MKTCKFSPDFISRIRESTILPNRNAHNLCINDGVPDIDQVRSITKKSQWRSNVDIDQVSFISVDIASEGLVQKFHIHPVCTGATEVGKLQIQQRARRGSLASVHVFFATYLKKKDKETETR